MATRVGPVRAATFLAVFVLAMAASLLASLFLGRSLIEAANIILFVPLFWAFLSLRPGGMVVAGAVLAGMRIAIEAVHIWRWSPQHRIDVPNAIDVAFAPILLYVALGIVLYGYRRRQAVLTAHLIEAGTVEARNRIASSLAHDFNNLLTVIIGTAELLLRDHGIAGPLRKDLENVLHAGEQGMSLVQQMRQASRGQPEEASPQDLADLTDRQMSLIERILPPNIHVVRHSSGALPVRVDKGQILRVLMNLCLNAKEAMSGGGVLTVRTGRRDIGGKPFAELVVSDTGPGIAPSLVEKVFEPFFTTRQSKGGVGLGLTIVR